MKKYIKLADNDRGVTHAEIRVYYDLGGYNLATYKEEARGYYLTILPIKREDKGGYILNTFEAFSGLKLCLQIVNRKSAKIEKQVIDKVLSNIEQLVNFALQDTGLEVDSWDLTN